jgi:hypothetical protein
VEGDEVKITRNPDRPNELTIEVEFVPVVVDEADLLEALAGVGVLERRDYAVGNGVSHYQAWKETK